MGRTMAPSPSRGGRLGPAEFFVRLGRFCVRRRWWIVGVWLAVLAVAALLAPSVVGKLRAGGVLLRDLQAAGAEALLPAKLGPPPSAPGVVFYNGTAAAGQPTVR